MNVGEITKLLGGIANGLPDQAKKVADGVLAFKSSMEPFAGQTLEQFISFLGLCDEYKRTGKVPEFATTSKTKPKAKKENMSAADAETKLRNLLSQINQGVITTPVISDLLAEIEKGLTKPQLDELLNKMSLLGKTKSKKEAIEKLRQMLNSQLEMYVKAQAFSDPK